MKSRMLHQSAAADNAAVLTVTAAVAMNGYNDQATAPINILR